MTYQEAMVALIFSPDKETNKAIIDKYCESFSGLLSDSRKQSLALLKKQEAK